MLCKKSDDTYSRALSSLYISNYHILGYIQQRKGEGEEIKENTPPLKVFIDGVYLSKIESINIQMK